MKKIISILLILVFALSITACSKMSSQSATSSGSESSAAASGQAEGVETGGSPESAQDETTQSETAQSETAQGETVTAVANVSSDGAIDASDMFTDRDLRQTADLLDAVYCTVSSGENISITAAGVYVFSGTASNVSIIVETDDAKVQLVLDGVSITNDSAPCIYVKNAAKVFVTTTETQNTLAVTGAFTKDGDTNTDAVIFSRDDLVFNGLGTLEISSSDNGVSGKDDIRITGGTLSVSASGHGIEANDSICIADGTITVRAKADGLHASNDDDASAGFVYICGGTLDIEAADDGIHAVTVVQIDGGDISISAAEGIEATWIQINGGTVYIYATDDGINAGKKTTACAVLFEMNGGYLTVVMGAGDTDAIDSNGNLYINGGTVDISAQTPFDYDGTAQYNGGTIIVNGVETNTITNQMLGGGPGGMGGGPGRMG